MKWIKVLFVVLALAFVQLASATTVKELTGKELFRAF